MKMHIIGTGTATVSKYINTSCVFEEDNLSELFYRERLENDFIREFW